MKFVKSSLLVKLVILILVVYATVTLVRLRSQISEKEAEAAGLTSSIASTQQENDRLQSSIDALDTPEGLEQVARAHAFSAPTGDSTCRRRAGKGSAPRLCCP